MKKLFLFALAPLVFSCTSLQQDVSIEQVSYSEEVLGFEERLSKIDADALIPNVDLNDSLQKEQKIDDFIDDISIPLADSSVQKSQRARLLALRGKAELLAGRKGKAKSLCEESAKAYKGDAQAAVLLSRIEGLQNPDDIEKKENEAGEKAVLILESALNFFKAKRFSESAAKFDEAFLSLAPFYRDSYGKIRDIAWNMRGIDENISQDIADIIILKEINVTQMLILAQSRNELFYNLAGGKKQSKKELFNRVSASGILNPVSKPLDGTNALGESDRVSKIAAARFLWNLHCLKNSSIDAKKYSSKLKKSPVPDLSEQSADFDAVLGCVESEIMSLEDGRNFAGERSVSAVEFDGYMEKMSSR